MAKPQGNDAAQAASATVAPAPAEPQANLAPAVAAPKAPVVSAPVTPYVHYANVISARRAAQSVRVQIHGALAYLFADEVELTHWDCPAAVDKEARQAEAEKTGTGYFKKWAVVTASDIFAVSAKDDKVTVVLKDSTKYVI